MNSQTSVQDPGAPASNDETELQKIGKYVVLRKLGTGNFGVVHLVRDTETGNNFAMKSIDIFRIEKHAKIRELFMTEINVMNKVKHPNIIHLHGFMKSKTHYLLIIDYCNGGDFQKKLAETPQGYFEEEQAVTYLAQILEGFKELQKHKILHRDFKMANLFLHNDQVVIGDFGFAKEGFDVTSTELGTPVIRAPEMAALGTVRNYNSKVDVWSMGVVFYEMLFGENPFFALNPKEINEKIDHLACDRLPFPRKVSEEAMDFLRKTIQKNPNNRMDWDGCFSHPLILKHKAKKVETLAPPRASVVSSAQSSASTKSQSPPEKEKIVKISQDSPEKKPSSPKAETTTEMSKKDQAIAKEIDSRMKHEDNIIVFFISTFAEVNKAIELSEFASMKRNLTFVGLLILKKACIISAHFATELIAHRSVVSINQTYFDIFVNSIFFSEIVKLFDEKRSKLKASFAKFVETKLAFTFSENNEFLFDPNFTDVKLIDTNLSSQVKTLVNMFRDLGGVSADLKIFFFFLIACIIHCFDSVNSFKYMDPKTKKRFEWTPFLESYKTNSITKVEAFLEEERST